VSLPGDELFFYGIHLHDGHICPVLGLGYAKPAGFASKLGLAFTTFAAREIEPIAGDPAAAERHFRERI
jgi:hypothetical protein